MKERVIKTNILVELSKYFDNKFYYLVNEPAKYDESLMGRSKINPKQLYEEMGCINKEEAPFDIYPLRDSIKSIEKYLRKYVKKHYDVDRSTLDEILESLVPEALETIFNLIIGSCMTDYMYWIIKDEIGYSDMKQVYHYISTEFITSAFDYLKLRMDILIYTDEDIDPKRLNAYQSIGSASLIYDYFSRRYNFSRTKANPYTLQTLNEDIDHCFALLDPIIKKDSIISCGYDMYKKIVKHVIENSKFCHCYEDNFSRTIFIGELISQAYQEVIEIDLL